MWILLGPLASAAPLANLCAQPSLDALAAAENARWAAIGLLDLSRTAHQLSEKSELTYEGVVLRKGDRVTTRGAAGTFKPDQTGRPTEVRATVQHGTILCFTRSTSGDIHNELAVVRWDPQRWPEAAAPNTVVALPAFEAPIHPSYLQVDPPVQPR